MGTWSNVEIKERHPEGYDCHDFHFVPVIVNLGAKFGVTILNFNFHI